MSEHQHRHHSQQQQSQQQQHHHHRQDTNLTAKFLKDDFICRLNYNNKLPPIPVESKLLSLPFKPSDYDKYQLTTLELKRKYDPVIPKRIAIFARDFIDPATYTPVNNDTSTNTTNTMQQPVAKRGKFLDIEDFELLEDTNPYKLEFDSYLAAKDAEEEKSRRDAEEEAKREAKRRQQKSHSANSDSKRSSSGQMTSSSQSQSQSSTSSSSSSSSSTTKDTVEFFRTDTLSGQRSIIEKSFEDAKKLNIKHPENPSLKVDQIIPIFPSFELYGVENVYVRSRTNPLFDRETSKAEDRDAAAKGGLAARSVIRGVTGVRRAGGNAQSHLIQVLYPDDRATKEGVESQKIGNNEEVYTYSGFFDSENMFEKRTFGIVLSKNKHKNDSLPGVENVAEYLRFGNMFQLKRVSGGAVTAVVADGEEKGMYTRVGRRDMNGKEEAEFEKKQEALSKPDRGNVYETEAALQDDEDDEEEDEEGGVNGEDEGEVGTGFDGDDDAEYEDANGVPSPSSSSDSE